MKLGANDITDFKIGSNDINEVRIGSDLVWQRAAGAYLLDTYPNAAAAYSLRQLKSGITNVVRVRRSTDNTEQDFTPTEITNGTLTTFTGSGDGFVTKLYDQSGNGNDTVQTVTGSQPTIVSSGLTILENGQPSLLFNNDYLSNSTNFSGDLTAISVSGYATESDSGILNLSSSSTSFTLMNRAFGSQLIHTRSNAGVLSRSGISSQHLIFATTDSLSNISLDVNQLPSDGTSNSRRLYDVGAIIGGITPTQHFFRGNIQEIVVYNSDQSTNRSGIETEINNHYSIY